MVLAMHCLNTGYLKIGQQISWERRKQCDKVTLEEFLKRTRKIHGDKYDYSFFDAMEFVDMSIMAKSIAAKRGHGEFRRTPTELLS